MSESSIDNLSPVISESSRERVGRAIFWAIEFAALWILFALYAGTSAPDVNEAHYLAKAKHFWDPSWCAGDLFLESSNAHPLFYLTFGWLSLAFSLETFAWIGRAAVWAGLAAAWVDLVRGTTPRFPAALLSGFSLLMLLHHGHMAGEWMIGGLEAKGPAFVLMLIGLGRMVRGDWLSCWWWWGGAAAFHVLVGGWTVLAAIPVWLVLGRFDERRAVHSEETRDGARWWLPQPVIRVWSQLSSGSPLKRLLVGWCGGGLLASLGVIPGIGLESGVSDQAVELARMTYVYIRLPHHLVISQFDPVRILSFVAVLLIWVMVIGSVPSSRAAWRMHGLALGALMFAAVGVAIDRYVVWSGDQVLGAALLRYYWFRSSDVLVPIAVSIGAVQCLPSWSRLGVRAWGTVAGCSAIALLAFWGTVEQHHGDGRPRADQQSLPRGTDLESTQQILADWKRLGTWIDEELPGDAIVITPREQQTFKWYAGRAEVANRKDVPQDAVNLIEWLKRIEKLHTEPAAANIQAGVDFGMLIYSDETLRELGNEYSADYLIVPRYQVYLRSRDSQATKLPIAYPPRSAEAEEQASYWILLDLRTNR